MRKLGFILVVILTATSSGPTSADELPLFAAFQSFCINTGAGPDAVKPAVEMAGGKMLKSPASSGGPYPMIAMSWTITVDGHKMEVWAMTSHNPSGPGRVADGNHCSITSFANEDGSIAKIQEWVGVPASSYSTPDLIYYDYQEQGQVRRPLPEDKSATAAIMETGHSWTLTIRPKDGPPSVQLMHLLGVKPAPSVEPGRPPRKLKEPINWSAPSLPSHN
jgi:hypothetical protein